MPQAPLSIPQAYMHAMQLAKQGAIPQAVGLLEHILQVDARNFPAATQLARILLRAGQSTRAKTLLESVESQAQDNHEVLHMLGALRLQAGELEPAKKSLERALILEPSAQATITALGNTFLEGGEFEDAIAQFKSAIELNPNHADPHNNIAWAYRAMGEKQEAIKHFRKAYQIDKSITEALSGILLLDKCKNSSEEVLEAKNRLEDQDLSPGQRTDLLFALGKAYEDKADYDRAVDYFKRGNATWRKQIDYKIEDDQALFEQLKKTFDSSDSFRLIEPPISPVTPIFVLGMPRSATSLVEQILASHSLVTGAGELPHLHRLVLDPSQAGWNKERAHSIRTSYLKAIQPMAKDSPYLVDKMPQNFVFLGHILACFPEAKIIHCQRDPKDNCLSLYKHHFPMTSHGYSYSSDDLAQYYHLYQDLMAHWKQLAPSRILDLQYETLVDNFEDELGRLLTHVGLEFEESCLHFQETKRAIRTASSDQVRRGLYKSGVDQWRHYESSLAHLFEKL